ncbi:MAG: hypothetical protein ABSF13_11515 [Smithella sp.]|jgi:hypothetical protein
MLNHLHFIGTAPDMIAVIRDIKTFLAKELKKNIGDTEPRILKLFVESMGSSLLLAHVSSFSFYPTSFSTSPKCI